MFLSQILHKNMEFSPVLHAMLNTSSFLHSSHPSSILLGSYHRQLLEMTCIRMESTGYLLIGSQRI